MISLTDTQTVNDIIDGWKEKLSMSNAELSKLVPFVILYSVIDPNDKVNNDKDKDLINELGFRAKIQGVETTEEKMLIPVFGLDEQQSTLKNDILMSDRGPAGIEQLTVSVANVQLNGYTAQMRISIPSFDRDMKTNFALRRLVIPASRWIIAYGWARPEEGSSFDPANTGFINLNDSHKGFYRFIDATLLRFDWQMSIDKIASGNLVFMSQINNIMTSLTLGNFKKEIKADIQKSKIIKTTTSDLPVDQFIRAKRTVFEQPPTGSLRTTPTSKVQSEIAYYYLGWVVESVVQRMSKNREKPFKLVFDNTKVKVNVRLNKDDLTKTTPLEGSNPGWIPIPAGDVDSLLDQQQDSFSSILQGVCLLATAATMRQHEIIAQIDTDGNTIKVGDLNTTIKNLKSEMLPIYVGAQNSLVESVSFGSRIPKDLTFGYDILVSTDRGASIIYNTFRRELTNPSGKPLSEIAKMIKKIEDETNTGKIQKETLDVIKRDKFKQILKSGLKEEQIDSLYNTILSNPDIPVGLALRAYFTDLTIEMHGLAAAPPWMHVDFRGFVEGIDGDYFVFQTTDNLTPGSFSTTMELKLSEFY